MLFEGQVVVIHSVQVLNDLDLYHHLTPQDHKGYSVIQSFV